MTQPGPATPEAHIIAPSGRLRAAINFGNAVLAQRGAGGAPQGMSVRLAQRAAAELGLELDLVEFEAAGKVFDSIPRDLWDLAFMAIDPKRAEQLCFSAPYVVIQGSYLVRENAPFRTTADVDAKGVRIAASHGSAYELHLRRAIQHAEIVAPQTPEESFQAFLDQDLDALAGVRPALVQHLSRRPGLRVLQDSFLEIRQAAALPRRSAAALPWLEHFIARAKRDGFVSTGLQETGQADAAVAD